MTARPLPWVLLVLLVGFAGLLLSGSRWLAPSEGFLLQILLPVQRTLTEAGAGFDSFADGLTRGWRLAGENEALRAEVAQLSAEVVQLRHLEGENRELRALLQYARENPQWHYTGAQVIGYDPLRITQAILLDKGSADGVDPGLVVVTSTGLVGRVIATSAHTAQVLLMMDPRSAVNAQIQDSGILGVVRALPEGELTMEFVEESALVEVGDIVVTSGLGALFPPGLLIGQVTEISAPQETGLFRQVRLRPAVAFPRLRSVLIIQDFTPASWP